MKLYELSPARFNKVAPLFEDIWVRSAMVDWVLEGRRRGRVFVDDWEKPTACLLCEELGNYYIVGDARPGAIRRFIKETPFEAEVFNPHYRFIYYLAGEDWINALNEDFEGLMEFFPLKVFRFNHASIEPFGGLRGSLPKNALVKRIDHELFERLSKEFRFTNSYQQFNERDFGFVTLVGDAIASVVWSHLATSKHAELFGETLEIFRHKGLATLTSLALIEHSLFAFVEHCLERELIPIWYCNLSNTGSAAAALRCGFEEGLTHYQSICQPYGADFKTWSGLWEKETDNGLPDVTIWHRINKDYSRPLIADIQQAIAASPNNRKIQKLEEQLRQTEENLKKSEQQLEDSKRRLEDSRRCLKEQLAQYGGQE